MTGQYYLRARYYNPVIGRFLQEDNYYGDGLNLYAYCQNNPVKYVDPSGRGTESAAAKNVDPNNAKNAQDLKDFIDEMNNTTGSTADDIEAFKSLAEEFGLDPDSLDIKTVNEVNGSALQELALEAKPDDASLIDDWAKEYHMNPDSLGIKSGSKPIGATYEGTIYRSVDSRYDPLEMSQYTVNSNHRYTESGVPGFSRRKL